MAAGRRQPWQRARGTIPARRPGSGNSRRVDLARRRRDAGAPGHRPGTTARTPVRRRRRRRRPAGGADRRRPAGPGAGRRGDRRRRLHRHRVLRRPEPDRTAPPGAVAGRRGPPGDRRGGAGPGPGRPARVAPPATAPGRRDDPTGRFDQAARAGGRGGRLRVGDRPAGPLGPDRHRGPGRAGLCRPDRPVAAGGVLRTRPGATAGRRPGRGRGAGTGRPGRSG